MKRVLILGAGFGGLSAAHTLRQLLLSEDEIVVVDKSDRFMVGFRKTWDILGENPLDPDSGALQKLSKHNIRYVQGTVTQLDPDSRAAEVDGRRLEGDALIVALGAKLAPEDIPGLEEHGLNIYAPGSLSQVKNELETFSGGRLVVGVFGLPYKCPAAPYEIALLVNEWLRSRQVEASVQVFTPQPMSLPVLGDVGCGVIEGRLGASGVGFLANHKATSVEPGRVYFANGREVEFDLLLAVAPHRCPEIVVEAGLTSESGWVKVNPNTMETSFPGIYAAGDIVAISMANGKRLPMAGVFAEAEGEVAAHRIAANFLGGETNTSFEGFGGCYLEVGNGRAMMVEGHFLAKPAPKVELAGPNVDFLHKKIAFERTRLERWLG